MTRNKYAELYEQMKAEMEQPSFKEKLYERMRKIEGVMNELKNYHDLKRAQYRGLENTQIQAYLAAMALNIKSVVFFYLLHKGANFDPISLIFFNRPGGGCLLSSYL